MMAKTLIGITLDIAIENKAHPPRDFYFLDAQNGKAMAEAGAALVMLPHDIEAIDTYLERLDGVMIAGGGWQFPSPQLVDFAATEDLPAEKVQRTRFELALIASAEARNVPILGICGGFQTMNVAAGGAIVPNLEASNAAWSHHADAGRTCGFDKHVHDVVIKHGTRLAAIVGEPRLPVNSGHSQGVTQAAPGLTVSATSDDGVVEAIERPSGTFWMALQWHPEFHISDGDRLILKAFVTACAEGTGLL
jgi:putative glutamine amidotransferase